MDTMLTPEQKQRLIEAFETSIARYFLREHMGTFWIDTSNGKRILKARQVDGDRFIADLDELGIDDAGETHCDTQGRC